MKGSLLVAYGRPPPRELALSNAAEKKCFAGLKRSTLDVAGRREVQARSGPGIADKAVELAKEVLDTDLSEVLETVQTASSDAVITTTEAIQVRNGGSADWLYGISNAVHS